ncbi:MAG: hypothetical protein HYX53_17685 [Chloroflexi bacterium]|nr:hypothetical protein [Chloroflexota bacterium]
MAAAGASRGEPTLVAQLCAILRARWAVSAQGRRESPAAWYVRAVLFAAAGIGLPVALFTLGLGVGRDRDIEPGPAAVLLLAPGLAAAGVLLFTQIQSVQAGHPLGDALLYAPLARRRAGLLWTLDSLANPGTLFILAMAAAPWLGLRAGGAHWLNGWAVIFLAAFGATAVLLRELALAIHRYLMDLTQGLGSAVLRVGFFLAMVTIPLWTGAVAGLFAGGNIDPSELPALRWMREPGGSAVVVGAAGLLFGGAAWIRARPRPHGFGFNLRRVRPARVAPVRAATAFAGGPVLGVILRMMAVQATRRPVYRYSAAILTASLALSFVTGGASNGFVVFAAFAAPMSGFFNLYGADAPYYTLWLASGRSLGEWTLARQLFFASYYLLFGGVALGAGVVFLDLPPRGVALVLPLFLATPLVAILAGPPVSRFVVTPQITEISQRKTAGRSPRTFVSPVAVAIAAAAVLGPGIAFLAVGLWEANWVMLGALAAVVLLVRPWRGEWSPALRERMAAAFRAS